ncbi:RCC1/BLIP-II [Meredithblackwellia eburnea MCA 4105]
MPVYSFGHNALSQLVPAEVSTELAINTPVLVPGVSDVEAATLGTTVYHESRVIMGNVVDQFEGEGVLLGNKDDLFALIQPVGFVRPLCGENIADGVDAVSNGKNERSGPYDYVAINGRGQVLAVSKSGDITLHQTPSSFLTPSSSSSTRTLLTLSSSVPPLRESILAVCAGASHFLLLTSTSVYSFGDNRYSQCGQPPSSSSSSKSPAPPENGSLRMTKIDFFEGLKPIAVAAGDLHSVVVTEGGVAYAFGRGSEGECGEGGGGEPELVVLELEGEEAVDDVEVLDVACGGNHTVLVTNKGVWVTGQNHEGQLGLGDTMPRLAFTRNRFFDNVDCIKAHCSRWATFITTREPEIS